METSQGKSKGIPMEVFQKFPYILHIICRNQRGFRYSRTTQGTPLLIIHLLNLPVRKKNLLCSSPLSGTPLTVEWLLASSTPKPVQALTPHSRWFSRGNPEWDKTGVASGCRRPGMWAFWKRPRPWSRGPNVRTLSGVRVRGGS